METSETKVTLAVEVALPTSTLELKHLKTRAGDPVVVHCEAMDLLDMAAEAGLPGLTPEMGELANGDGKVSVAVAVEKMRGVVQHAAPILERAVSLRTTDGAEVRPAFTFGIGPSHPLSIPGRYLHLEDVTDMVMEVMRLSGLTGGSASKATFPPTKAPGRRARARAGRGAVGVRKRGR